MLEYASEFLPKRVKYERHFLTRSRVPLPLSKQGFLAHVQYSHETAANMGIKRKNLSDIVSVCVDPD